MNTINKRTSSRKYLITSLLSISALVITVILMSVIYLVEVNNESLLEDDTSAWANSIAQASVSYLADNKIENQQQLKHRLKQLITTHHINYIHIYNIKNDGKIDYFTGFNKSILYPSIPDKIEQIPQLLSVRHHPGFIELVVKIEQDNKLYGYLYIQSSKKDIAAFISQLYSIAVLLLLLTLVAALIVAYTIHKKFNQPLSTIVASIQDISQNKNFHTRIPDLPMIEFDILARNINVLLSRAEKHINKQNDTHQQALLQNNTLTQKVQARTDALKESNQELLSTLEKLHQFQGKLVENEKMASLGDMVAGISHEVNTPIGLGVTASTLMADRLHDIKKAFEDKTLKSSQLKKFLIEGEENIGIIYRNLERAAKLISSFKKVAVDQSSAEVRIFNVKELLEEVLLTLTAKLNQADVVLTIDCPDNIIVESKPGPIHQILINLVLNSLLHGFENRPSGKIIISVVYLSEQLHLSFQDDGIGISESVKEKVFEPFTTTKRGSGGSGLGLHLVYNLVTQALNGHIDFESEAEVGTTFELTFPAASVSEK